VVNCKPRKIVDSIERRKMRVRFTEALVLVDTYPRRIGGRQLILLQLKENQRWKERERESERK
jgi:hypothetical protein